MKRKRPTKQQIEEFFSLPSIAMAGVSSNPKKFGAVAYRELLKKGIPVIPIHPSLQVIENQTCYSDLQKVPSKVEGVISMVPKKETLNIVQSAWELGIRQVWIQPRTETPEAIAFCKGKDMNLISGECILMHAPPVTSIHRFHQRIKQWFSPI